jgi:hypothetical protein
MGALSGSPGQRPRCLRPFQEPNPERTHRSSNQLPVGCYPSSTSIEIAGDHHRWLSFQDEYWRFLTRIIHIFEDNKSLLCYKHVEKTMFEQQKRLP